MTEKNLAYVRAELIRLTRRAVRNGHNVNLKIGPDAAVLEVENPDEPTAAKTCVDYTKDASGEFSGSAVADTEKLSLGKVNTALGQTHPKPIGHREARNLQEANRLIQRAMLAGWYGAQVRRDDFETLLVLTPVPTAYLELHWENDPAGTRKVYVQGGDWIADRMKSMAKSEVDRVTATHPKDLR